MHAPAARLDAKATSPANSNPTPGLVSSKLPRARRAAWRELPSGVKLSDASEGDQYVVHEFLRATVQRPSDEEFAAQLERPGYLPEHRLLLREGQRIVGHVLGTWRSIAWGEGVLVPSVDFSALCIAADRRGRGYGSALMHAAVKRAEACGVLLCGLRTKSPSFYQRLGWSVGSKQTWSSACPRDVLSLLSATTCAASLNVRIWRQVEQDALQRLHQRACDFHPGQIFRDDELWRWLASRNARDRIYVAVDGSPGVSDAATDSLVAFAIVRGARIVECCAEPGRADAVQELLRRVCYDAIESDEMEVRCDAPLDSPLHSLLTDSGGRHYHVDADRDMVNMVRIPSSAAFLNGIRGELERRAKAAGLSRPTELGLAINNGSRVDKLRIAVAKKSIQIASGKVGRSYLSGDEASVQQLLLGRVSLPQAIADGRLDASTQTAIDLGAALLPSIPVHRPVLDDLPANA